MKLKIITLLIATVVLVAGCDQSQNASSQNTPSQNTQEKLDRSDDRASVAQARIDQGKSLFVKNCAACHGSEAQGSTDWRKRDKHGKYPPPPLNGTAHTWHHPKQALIYTIKNGTKALGGSMPAWKDKITDEEIESIIFWFQAKWPEQIYQAWVKRDQESRQRAN